MSGVGMSGVRIENLLLFGQIGAGRAGIAGFRIEDLWFG
jgi:hypothetical protein